MMKKYEFKTISAWDEGPDVLLVHKHGTKTSWFDLTYEEARKLAAELLVAASEAEMIQKECNEYFEKEEQI